MATRNPIRVGTILNDAADAAEAADVDPMEQALLDEATDNAAAVDVGLSAIAAGGTPLGLTFDQLMQLVKAGQSNAPTYEQMAEMATRAAHAGADRVKPKELSVSEVERRSPFNPLGDRDHPRPKLKCAMFLGAAPLGSTKEVTTLTRAEIDALNDLTPGHYRVRKMDGSTVIVEVKGRVNANQQLDRLWMLFPDGDEQKTLYPPLDVLARACCEDNRVNPGL